VGAKSSSKNMTARIFLADLDLGEKIILKWILKKDFVNKVTIFRVL